MGKRPVKIAADLNTVYFYAGQDGDDREYSWDNKVFGFTIGWNNRY